MTYPRNNELLLDKLAYILFEQYAEGNYYYYKPVVN